MQYKETPSPLQGNYTLDMAYAGLSGDTPLYSVFRIDGEPVPCPFRDTFLFSYNRGNGNCSNPPSVSDSCTDKGRVLFKFKACYDTHSESRKETLTCVGTWKEGSHHYLVGKSEGGLQRWRRDDDDAEEEKGRLCHEKEEKASECGRLWGRHWAGRCTGPYQPPLRGPSTRIESTWRPLQATGEEAGGTSAKHEPTNRPFFGICVESPAQPSEGDLEESELRTRVPAPNSRPTAHNLRNSEEEGGSVQRPRV
ncbi:hypothetical protein BIW11_09950 [Tropilaelaps mercedesae]|uniref:DUF7042 domain-containing protein n=1 Tax=Tropilaelaps mercedesae TaxID=418985 RepID=A0A1V9XI68_9ACAR|nr:hypothetical protein BIW11_09950 [Tropilaelaps mercedesae]